MNIKLSASILREYANSYITEMIYVIMLSINKLTCSVARSYRTNDVSFFIAIKQDGIQKIISKIPCYGGMW